MDTTTRLRFSVASPAQVFEIAERAAFTLSNVTTTDRGVEDSYLNHADDHAVTLNLMTTRHD